MGYAHIRLNVGVCRQLISHIMKHLAKFASLATSVRCLQSRRQQFLDPVGNSIVLRLSGRQLDQLPFQQLVLARLVRQPLEFLERQQGRDRAYMFMLHLEPDARVY